MAAIRAKKAISLENALGAGVPRCEAEGRRGAATRLAAGAEAGAEPIVAGSRTDAPAGGEVAVGALAAATVADTVEALSVWIGVVLTVAARAPGPLGAPPGSARPPAPPVLAGAGSEQVRAPVA